MLGVAEADLQLEGGSVRVKGAPACANRSPSLSTRTIGVPGFADDAWSRRARPGCTELTADGGPRVRIHLSPAKSQERTCLVVHICTDGELPFAALRYAMTASRSVSGSTLRKNAGICCCGQVRTDFGSRTNARSPASVR
jgi:hypothetical protein